MTTPSEEIVVTLQEVLEEDESLLETARAVLGKASATHCSYPDGYIRQALFSCLTCKSNGPAGICLACSLKCHAGHELVELYTKRHFRCDCGNSKFQKDTPCTLYEGKDTLNDENIYSQNFQGLYCTCHRPHPDPERETQEIMMQCIICEDWHHQEHVYIDGATTPDPETDFDEMICRSCMEAHSFIYQYVDGVSSHDTNECPVKKNLTKVPTPPTPTFWTHGWRDTLCKCESCMILYKNHQCAYLLDESDSLLSYEEETANEKLEDITTASEKAIQKVLSHEQQVEMAMGFHHMASSFKDFFSGFASTGKTVRAEDIHGFFETLRATKRQKKSE